MMEKTTHWLLNEMRIRLILFHCLTLANVDLSVGQTLIYKDDHVKVENEHL